MSIDDGSSWYAPDPTTTVRHTHGQKAVHCSTATGTWISAGQFGHVFRSVDAGATWALISATTLASSETNFVTGLFEHDGGRWVAVDSSGGIALSVNDGTTWSPPQVLPADLSSVEGGVAGGVTYVSVGGWEGWLAADGAGHLLRSLDRGLTWSRTPASAVIGGSQSDVTTAGFAFGSVRAANGVVILTGARGTVLRSSVAHWRSDVLSGDVYRNDTGEYNGAVNLSGTYTGAWLALSVPEPIRLFSYVLESHAVPGGKPVDWRLFGSEEADGDGNEGGAWVEVHAVTGASLLDAHARVFRLPYATSVAYRRFALVVGRVVGGGDGETISAEVRSLRFTGTPSSALVPYFRVKEDHILMGNAAVGVGVEEPEYALHVEGDVFASDAVIATRYRVRHEDGEIRDLRTNAVIGTTTPVGTLTTLANDVAPPEYLKADGSIVGREEFGALFRAIGTRYGEGDGSTTFGLP